MEDDLSSTTNVFCGPLTLEEIRQDLTSRKPRETIDRRATISNINPSRTVYSDSPTQDYLIKKQFFGSDTDDLSESFISEYFTPNETLHNDKSLATSKYATPCESLQNSAQNDIGSNLNRSSSKGDNIMIIKSAGECSNFNIHKPTISRGIRESQYLERVSDTVLVSSDDDDYYNENSSELSNKSNDESLLETTDENMQNYNSPSQIYIISSDADSSFEEQIQIKTELDEQLTELSLQQNDKIAKLIDLEALELPKVNLPNLETPPKPAAHNNSTTSLLCDHSSSNVSCDGSNTSPMLQQIENASLHESSGYDFNDTLEEMEMALKHGLDYTMPDETTENCKTDIAAADHFQQHQFLYADSPQVHSDKLSTGLSTNKPKLTSDKFKKTLIPVKSSQTNITPQKNINPIRPLSTKQDFNFKVPSKPVTSKTLDFKNVVSPVAVYIKNSPKVPQVQHVLGKPLITGPLFPKLPASTVSNKENDKLPFRLYKPAKHAIVSKETELKLPGSVQKYIPNTPDIIKHRGRVAEKTTNSVSIEAKLLDEDLTMCDNDASFSSSSVSLQDVSLHTTKKAYIK